MVLSDVHILGAAYLIGFAAAAPIGPVNMLAIRRGIVGRWTHTLACGLGSVAGDLMLFVAVLLGGRWLMPNISSPHVQSMLAIPGAMVLMPLGGYFLFHAFRRPLHAYVRAKRAMRDIPPKHLLTDVGTGAILTVINPAGLIYWIGVTANWMPQASATLGWGAAWWGLVMTGSGLLTWFGILTLLVKFTPQRIGPAFFRIVNFGCGLVLLGFGIFCVSVFWRNWN